MPVNDKYQLVRAAIGGAKNIHAQATALQNQAEAIPFGQLRGRLDSMRDSYFNGIQPVVDLGTAAQVNPVVATFFAGAPANTYSQLEAIETALIALYTAYDTVFDTLTPITHTPAGGHEFAEIPLAQLSSLSDELADVLTAAAPMV